ncbi:hypothetical protein [Formosa sp. L2A11]|uniref:hypothetical protein n=1 Tax=Formosa sp. L2A11 TaxID=2686363 RepID=UPI00131CAB43|nr:hypothetical protein [Formosa sp. L2A11]
MKYIIIFLLFVSTVSAQEKVQQRQFTSVSSIHINESTVIYDFDTKALIELKDLGPLIEKYPKSGLLDKDTDLNGNATSYYFVKDANVTNSTKENQDQVTIKQKDITNTVFDLSAVDSKYTVVILQLDLEFPRINVESIKDVEKAALGKGFTSIILTQSNANQAKTFASSQGLKSTVIPNASTVMKSFNTNSYPFFVILDKNKSIVYSGVKDYGIIDELLTLE